MKYCFYLVCLTFLLGNSGLASEELRQFTGAKTRVVWISQPGEKDLYARGNNHTLWALESGDKEPRKLISEPGNYYTPLMSPDGSFVVYSDLEQAAIFRVNWESGERREITTGAAAALWRDPSDGRIFLYAQEERGIHTNPLVRFPIDEPDQLEPVWDKSRIEILTPGSFHLSRDGKWAAALFPWPRSGIASLPNGGMEKHRDGCWPGIAPDDSGVHWTFDGSHRILMFNRPGRDEYWKVNLSGAPGMDGEKVYHPRWTNHPAFLVMTGPYPENGKRPSNVVIGKFSDDFNAVEDWIQVTDTPENAYFPSVWIEGGEAHESLSLNSLHAENPDDLEEEGGFFSGIASFFSRGPDKLSKKWPGTDKGLVFLWEDNFSDNRVELPSGDEAPIDVELTGNARFGPAGQLHLVQGAAVADKAHSKHLVEEVQEAGEFTLEAIVEPQGVDEGVDSSILSMSKDVGARNFALSQRGDALLLHLRTSKSGGDGTEFRLASLEAGKPVHVLVKYRPGLLVCSVGGREVIRHGYVTGDFKKWEDFPLIFGSEQGREQSWHGYLDSTAIYSRFIEGEEAAQKLALAAERIATRPDPATQIVEARQLTRSAPPDVESVAPYRRVLMVNQYEIIEGNDALPQGLKVAVAEWAMLDGKTPADYQASSVGSVRQLALEDFNEHPQLESERQINDMDALELPFFYHAGSGASLANDEF